MKRDGAMYDPRKEIVREIDASRRGLYDGLPRMWSDKVEEEGGCGVTGFCCTVPVAGRHIYAPSVQMHNRGNGKGGGIAAVGLIPEQLGVSREVLESHYMLQIAVLDDSAVKTIEKKYVYNNFDVAHTRKQETIDDWHDIKTLLVKPPDIHRYFVRVKPAVLDGFIKKNKLTKLPRQAAEDEFMFQNSTRINVEFYAALGEKRAFVISHGRNMMIMKIVGYAEETVEYYKLKDLKAHVWIAHQRYPTKGRVWHPAGAHPFMGMDEALVHNGDFANYYSVSEYLQQRNIRPLFLTDTEVSILVFDLLNRTYGYPLEYIIESLAPTTEMDLDLLPARKQEIYRRIQSAQIHGSPDGPWFFIIARNLPGKNTYQLMGITDTAMLRPQVFAIQEGDVQIGLVCSEKQAIDATLQSLASEDPRFSPIADKYWNARGGSSDNGGAFIFTVTDDNASPTGKKMECTDKFGNVVTVQNGKKRFDPAAQVRSPNGKDIPSAAVGESLAKGDSEAAARMILSKMKSCDYDTVRIFVSDVVSAAKKSDAAAETAIEVLTKLNDGHYDTGKKKKSSILEIANNALREIFLSFPRIDATERTGGYRLVDWASRRRLRAPKGKESVLVINSRGFQPELEDRDSKLVMEGHRLGWKKFIVFNTTGQRFHGVGLGAATEDVRIDCYGIPGDYLASGIDGLELQVHGDAQDQVGQIIKAGKLVIHGSVGQTFMYGAKGGEVYVKGNAAGRPLINAVGRPRVIINGTCLDYLA
ncbi:MAG TPA: glutamate synthase, partial [bacterium]|nr:glutamate synthase [bacterium]